MAIMIFPSQYLLVNNTSLTSATSLVFRLLCFLHGYNDISFPILVSQQHLTDLSYILGFPFSVLPTWLLIMIFPSQYLLVNNTSLTTVTSLVFRFLCYLHGYNDTSFPILVGQQHLTDLSYILGFPFSVLPTWL